jgi:His-Xaa-Ser system radical SAM maturase HxsB
MSGHHLPRAAGAGLDLAPLIELPKVDAGFAVPFNFRVIDGDFFISNGFGDWLFLAPPEFKRFIEGDVRPDEPLYQRLSAHNFIAATIDRGAQALRWADKHRFLFAGPTLHAFVLTGRCNFGCQYCHSSIVGMHRKDTDMSIEVAERAVDMTFRTTSPGVTIEFQGGEPLANWEVLQHVVEYARQTNALAGKALSFSLVSNLTLLDDEKLEYLIDRRVQICTSIDGPADHHNSQRIWKGGDSFEVTTGWMKRINERYVELGLDPNLYRVEALPTITRPLLGRARELVDTFVELGCRALFLRKLDPFGFAARSARTLGYSMEAFIAFYAEALEYIIELNRQGVQVMERNAAIMLSKMIADTEPNYLDLRSPGGAVIGQIGYHPEGTVYSSDEGRFVAAMGDNAFLIGSLENTYEELMTSATTRALVLAGINDAQPDCVSCVYKPYCGQQPEYNYKTQGSIQGRMRDSTWCKKHKSIFDLLAHRLKHADAEEMAMFRRWTINRPQEHFLQERGPL